MDCPAIPDNRGRGPGNRDPMWALKRVHFKNFPLFIRNTTTFVNELINILDEVTCLFFCILIGCKAGKPQKFDHNYFLIFHPGVNQVTRVPHSRILRSSSTILSPRSKAMFSRLLKILVIIKRLKHGRPGTISISTLSISRWQVLIYRFYNEDTKDCNQYCTIVHLKSCLNHY